MQHFNLKTIFFIFLPALSFSFIIFFGETIADILSALIPGRYNYENADRIYLVMLAAFYLGTIVYIFAFICRKFERLAILPISFPFTIIPAYIYDELNPSFLISGFELVILIYTLPFTVIATIAVIVVKIRAACKKK